MQFKPANPLSAILLASLLTSMGCYTAMHPLRGPHGCCNCRFNEQCLADALDNFCTGKCLSSGPCKVGCGDPIDLFEPESCDSCTADVCVEECQTCACHGCLLKNCPLRHCHWRPGCNVEPGPPPETFYPQLPPKFLPVPTQPVFAATNPYAPVRGNGSIEQHWSPQLSSPR